MTGCLRFDVLQTKTRFSHRFYYYEVYKDDAALEAHRQTPHFKLYAEKVQGWLAAPPDTAGWEEISFVRRRLALMHRFDLVRSTGKLNSFRLQAHGNGITRGECRSPWA